MNKKSKPITKKTLEKQLKKHMQERYQNILAYLNSNEIDAEKNVRTLINHEPSFFTIIKLLDNSRNSKKIEMKFYEKINMAGNDIDSFLKDIHSKQVLVQEMLDRSNKLTPKTPKEIRRKNTQIKDLEEKLSKLKKTEELLLEANKELAELDKRPRGRPRKDETEVDYDLEDEEEYAEEE